VTKLGHEARELVVAGRGALQPSADDRARVLEALRARIGAPPVVPNAGAPAPAPRAVSLGWGKVAAVVAGVVVVGAVGLRSLGPHAEGVAPRLTASPPVVVSAAPAAGPAEPATTAPESAPQSLDSVAASSAAPPAEASTPRRPSDRLGEEVSILSRAEAELHARRFASALRLLDEHQRKFPRGKLTQERVAAKIQALCALGRTSEADAALALLSPDSVHEGRARAACSKAQ